MQCRADPPGMPRAWVPEMARPFFSQAPGSFSGSQSLRARRLPRRLCRVEKGELQLVAKQSPGQALVGAS